MKNIKSTSGLTHGRGISEDQRNIWLANRPIYAYIKSEMMPESSNDNKEMREDRINLDCEDTQKIKNFFECHDPFDVSEHHLYNIGILYGYFTFNIITSLF